VDAPLTATGKLRLGGLAVNQASLVTAFYAPLLVILNGAYLASTPFIATITWVVILAILVYLRCKSAPQPMGKGSAWRVGFYA
jgi:hypothetical protein